MAKTWKKLCILEIAHYDDRDSTRRRFDHSIEAPSKIEQKILEHIYQDDAKSLQQALEDNFIYRSVALVSSNDYQGGHHSKYWEYQYFLVRPMAEALLFENLEVFRRLLEVLHGKDKKLQEAFISGCLASDIPPNIFQPIDNKTIQALESEIKKLKEHNHTHRAAQILAKNLTTFLSQRPITSDAAIEHLLFKINFVEKLHSQDHTLAKDPNYKKIFVNLAMLLLGFIPNILNLVFTGNFLFFKHTPQQACVARMNKPFEAMKQSEVEIEGSLPESHTPTPVSL